MRKLDIAIAGEINLDLILYGLPQELPAERELLGTSFTITLGSSSAILAHNLAALGSRVGFVGKVGDDPFGKLALERLAESGADITRVVRTQKTASGVSIILPHACERHILTYPGTISELTLEDLDLEYLASAGHFHMSSLFLHRALLHRIPELFQYMKGRGLTTSLDTNDDPDDRWDGVLAETLPYVDLLFPNEREVQKIAGVNHLDEAIALLAQRVPTLVVKLGAKGAVAVRDQERLVAPAVNVKVVDTIGAGDSFNAGFLHEYVRGGSLKRCLENGNFAGAFSTTASGGTEAFRNLSALREFLAADSALRTTAR
jgi:sugar/nucleoside kinase (ribokinase family)